MAGEWEYESRIIGGIILANLCPFLGLLVFDWDLPALLVVYWLEWGVAIIVGIVKTCPARLVTLQFLGGRYDRSMRNKRGTVTVCGFPCYVRNLPLVGILVFAGGVWLATGLLAFYRSASPFAYSTTETLPTVAIAASLLALSHVVTLRPYFGERRNRRISATEAIGLPLAYTLGMTSLVLLLADLGDHPASLGWLASYPVAIVGCKAGLEVLTRCRDRARFERIGEDADPFTVEQTVRQTMSTKRFTAELPPIPYPESSPRTTVRPDRRSVIAASPIVGLGNRLGWIWFGLSFVCAVFVAILGGPWPLVLLLGGSAIGGLTLLGLAISGPRDATLEYEFYDDCLVCYDRWLEEPQWRLPYADIDRVLIARGFVSRITGTGEVCLETTDGERARLPCLRPYWTVAEHLDRTVEEMSVSGSDI